MSRFASTISGLTIMVKPSFSEYDRHGSTTGFNSSKKIQFIDGVFETKDDEIIEFIRKYAVNKPAIVHEITDDDIAIMNLVKNYHAKKSGQGRGSQGAIGNSAVAADPVMPKTDNPKKPVKESNAEADDDILSIPGE